MWCIKKQQKKKGNFKILKLHFRALMFALYFNSDIILVEMKIKKQSSFKSLILKKARTSGWRQTFIEDNIFELSHRVKNIYQSKLDP